MTRTTFNALGNANLHGAAMQNIAINGFAEVSQEHASNGIASGFPADMWGLSYSGGMVMSGQRVAAPFPTAPGIRQGVAYRVTTAKATLAAADWAGLVCAIEGNRIARLAYGTTQASPITIGFWIRPYQNGDISFGLRTYGTTGRAYHRKRTLVANTDQFVTFTVPGDTFAAGTYTDARAGMEFWCCLGAGASLTGSVEGAWETSNRICAPGLANQLGTVGNGFIISGLMILPGTELPASDQWAFCARDYWNEEWECQRYWYRYGTYSSVYFDTSVNGVYQEATARHPRPMRSTTGSVALSYTDGNGVANQIDYVGGGGGVLVRAAPYSAGADSLRFFFSAFNQGTARNAHVIYNITLNARM